MTTRLLSIFIALSLYVLCAPAWGQPTKAPAVAVGKPAPEFSTIDRATDYVGMALDEALDGRSVTHPVTRAYGCPIEY